MLRTPGNARRFFVYIVGSAHRVLYIGVTNDLDRRIGDQQGEVEGFTRRYGVKRLLYFEEFQDPRSAIARETELKGWVRRRKLELIKTMNPTLSQFGILRRASARWDSSLRGLRS